MKICPSKKCCIIFVIMLIFSNSLNVLAADLFAIDINTDGASPNKAVALTPEIINVSGTTALRVAERESGAEVPFFIYTAIYDEHFHEESTSVTRLRRFERYGFYFTDFMAVTPENVDALISHLHFYSSEINFLMNIGVYGSHDDQQWHFITQGLFYIVEDSIGSEISLYGVQRYRYYRLRVPVQQYVNFIFYGIYKRDWIDRTPFLTTNQAYFNVTHDENSTNITITGLYGTSATMENLRVTGISIETDSVFKREVRTRRGPVMLYRLYFQDTEISSLNIPFSGQPMPAEINLTVINHDDRPIEINGITIEYVVDFVVFRAESDVEYKLLFGGNLTMPIYDIVYYSDLILQEGYDVATFTGTSRIMQYAEAADVDFQWLFNIAIAVAGVLLIGVAAVNLLKGKAVKQ